MGAFRGGSRHWLATIGLLIALAQPVAAQADSEATPAAQLAGWIAFAKDDDVWVVGADGSDVRRLTSAPGPEFDPALSPNGEWVAYRDSRRGINNDDEIYLMRSDGSGQVNLTNHPGNEWGPAWSPDGEQIVFSSDREGGFPKLFVMNQDGTGLRQLTEGWGEYPSWSPDGERIAFECLQGAGSPTSRPDYDICVVDAGGSGEAILVAHPANDGAPAWSPDGGTIAFQSERDACPDGKVVTSVEACEDGSVIYLVDADGSNPHRITEPSPPGGWETPDWSPAGDALVVAKSGKVVIVRPDGELLADLGPGNFPDWAAGS